MKPTPFLPALALSLVSILPLLGDQSIKFSNAAADVGPGKLVTFGTGSGLGLAGKGVVNLPQGGAAGTETRSYVAALFVSNGGALTQIGATANFRANTTASPGTWVGGTRTLVGVAQGTTLTLVVQAWDAAFANLDAAKAAGRDWGQSAPFIFKDAMSSPAAPADTLMVGFQGFSFVQIPEPGTMALGALGCGAVLWFSRRRH